MSRQETGPIDRKKRRNGEIEVDSVGTDSRGLLACEKKVG